MKIALCNDIPEFGGNRLANRDWADRFPGAGWVSEFFVLAAAHGWEVASGDIALSHVQCGYWSAADVWVIQELDSALGRCLREVGCRPLLLTCLESPLYASLFFDQWRDLADPFPHYMGPPVAGGPAVSSTRAWPLRFPCYRQRQRALPTDWEMRQAVVLVAANKYWSYEDKAVIPPWTRPRSHLRWRRHQRVMKASPSRQLAQDQQLHDVRLEAISVLSQAGMLALYGSGWDKLSVLPVSWQQRLKSVALQYHGKAEDKNRLQSGFKFVLCFENTAYPGYVTEKIIEALVAGAIPVYLGAPDISSYVPAETFIDAGSLSSMEELPALLMAFSPEDASHMIAAGQRFLDGELGQLHSYEGFAQWVGGLALEQMHAI